MPSRRRVGALLLLVLLASTTVVAAAAGATGWRAAVTLAPATREVRYGAPVVAIDARGDAIVAWGTQSGGAFRERRVGSWIRPRSISGFPQEAELNERGDGLLTWVDPRSGLIVVLSRRAGAAWQRKTFAPRVGDGVPIVRAELDARGGAIVVWSAWTGETREYVVERVARAATGAWTRPQLVARAEDPGDLALAANGEVLIAWSEACERVTSSDVCPSLGTVVRATTRPVGGGWSRPRMLSEPREESRLAAVAVNGSGTALVLWESFAFPQGARPVRAVKAVVGTTRGRFGRPQALFDDEAYGAVRVALAPTGEAVAAWSGRESPNADRVFTATRRPHGGFRPTVSLGSGFEPALAMDRNGVSTLVWTRPSGPTFPQATDLLIHAARRPAGDLFGAGVDVASVGQDCTQHRGCEAALALAGDAGGHEVAAWRAHSGSGAVPGETWIQASLYDPPR